MDEQAGPQIMGARTEREIFQTERSCPKTGKERGEKKERGREELDFQTALA